MATRTITIYENGQYNSEYFGETVSITTVTDPAGGTFNDDPACVFQSSYIELSASAYNYWWSRYTNFVFSDCSLGNDWEVYATVELSNVNNYYSYAHLMNADPTCLAQGNTVSGRYKLSEVDSNGKLTFRIRLDNNGSYICKITKIEIEIPVVDITSNGGGATHIAKVTGQLKDLSSNLSDILMVSGGGGGGLLVGEDAYAGEDAGGISGSGNNSGNQSSGYAFGQGESGTNVSGGGGGYYGGEKGGSLLSGGAGSGYIGNSLVSNKKMVGYNVPTSSAESTKTESVNVYSAIKEANKPKAGNGFARVKLVTGFRNVEFLDMLKTQDLTHRKTATNLGWYGGGIPASLSQYANTDWIMDCGVNATVSHLEKNNDEYILDGSQGHDTYMFYPIKSELIGKRASKFKVKALLYDIERPDWTATYVNIILKDTDVSPNKNKTLQEYNYNASGTHNILAVNTWYSFTKDLNGYVLPNYIQMYVGVGKWRFKDIIFEVEE